MLKLRHNFSFSSLFGQPSRRLRLSTVRHEDDELITAIERERSEDVLTLDATPDVRKLDEFWDGVENDLKKDPDWFNFDNS